MRMRRIDERGANWEGRCPQRPGANQKSNVRLSGRKLVSRIPSRIFLCGWRPLRQRPSQLFLAHMHNRAFLRALMRRLAAAEAAALPAISPAILKKFSTSISPHFPTPLMYLRHTKYDPFSLILKTAFPTLPKTFRISQKLHRT